MAKELVNVFPFYEENLINLSSDINHFLYVAGDTIKYIDTSIAYNTDEEKYVALVSYYVLDDKEFSKRIFK